MTGTIALPTRFVVLLLALAWSLTACGAPQKYTPPVTSTPSPSTPSNESVTAPTGRVLLIARIVKLEDVSPPEDKEDGWLYGSGWSLTSPERLNGDLDVLLTRFITNNLRRHGVFKEVIEDPQRAQVVVGGKIHRFYQRKTQYFWTLCCSVLGLIIPFPLMKEEGEVDLELTLSGLDGNTTTSYRGKSSFVKRCNAYESRCYESSDINPTLYLNEAFSDSFRQIVQQLTQDKSLIHKVEGKTSTAP